MKKSRQLALGIVLVLILALVSPVAAASFTVDAGNPNCDDVEGRPFCTIQAAIDAASPGDKVTVRGDDFGLFYEESIVIDKERLTVEGSNWPVIAPFDDDAAVVISADRVKFRKFAVGFAETGIVIDDAERVEVRENLVGFHFIDGILVLEGQDNQVIDNGVYLVGEHGIVLAETEGNRIQHNDVFFVDGGPCLSGFPFRGVESQQTFEPMESPSEEMRRNASNSSGKPKQRGAVEGVTPEDFGVAAEGERNSKRPHIPAGIYLYETGDNQISHNDVSCNGGYGIGGDFTGENRIESNQVDANGFMGIALDYAGYNQIRKNQLDYNMGPASIFLGYFTGENEVRENIVTDHNDYFAPYDLAGILIIGHENEIIRNQVIGTYGHGFWFWGDDNKVEHNLAEYNMLDGFHIGPVGPDSDGVAEDGVGNMFQSNRAIDNGDDGFDDESVGNWFRSNRAEDNGDDGIEVDEGTIVDRNKSEGNYGDGFDIGHDYNTLTNNEARENGENGFDIDGSNNHLERNNAQRNYDDGFDMGNDAVTQAPLSDNLLLNNRAERNGDDGFDLKEATIFNTLHKNYTSNNEGSGFEIDGMDNMIDDNRAYNNNDMGFEDESSSIFTKNRCRGNTNGSTPGTCSGE